MRPPGCPDHGTTVLELALGLLDDGQAAEAEQLRSSCPKCSVWWDEVLAGDQTTAVDAAVAAVIDGFEAPSRRRRPVWIAAAAAAAAVAGGALMWTIWPQRPPAIRPAEMVHRLFDDTVAVQCDLNGDGIVDASDLVASLTSARSF